MDILEFISTDEGQNLLIEDNIGMVSTVKGAVILKRQRCLTESEGGNAGKLCDARPVLGSLILSFSRLTSYIRGDISKKEIMHGIAGKLWKEK